MHITVQIEAPSALFCSSTPRSGLEEKKHLKQILKVHGGAKTLSFTDWRMLWILVGNRRSPGNRSDSKILQGFSTVNEFNHALFINFLFLENQSCFS